MRYAYPASIETISDDDVVLSFADVPEALVGGDSREAVLSEADEVLIMALAVYVQQGRDIPPPSAGQAGQPLIAVPPLGAAKLALYAAMREQGVSNSALARRLGVDEAVIRRLVDPDHNSLIGRVQDALKALGRELVVEDRAA